MIKRQDSKAYLGFQPLNGAIFCLFVVLGFVGRTWAEPEKVWQIEGGLLAPESAHFDRDSEALFISQIGKGGGKAADGDGKISKLTLTGNIIDANWVDQLNAPKGMDSHEGVLWVADITELIGIRIDSGEIEKRLNVDPSEMLNDVVCGSDGNVYVSDFFGNRIWRYRPGNDELTIVAEGESLEWPNGLQVLGDNLFFGSWGRDVADDFSTKEKGRIFKVNLGSKKVSAVTVEPTANFDGLEVDDSGGFVASDWYSGEVFHITENGNRTTLLQRKQGAADLCFVPELDLLIVPEMLENRVVCFRLDRD